VKFLALDTSSAQCSVAAWIDGQAVYVREVATARDHARLLLPMVDELLASTGLALHALDGIAFGRGPGSFTGVRIAAAVTQGLAAGAGLPVLPVSSLRALAEQARRRALAVTGAAARGPLLACMDARMREVYWGLFDPDIAPATEAVAAPAVLRGMSPIAAAGKALTAYPEIATWLQLPPELTFAAAEPHAMDVATLAALDLGNGAQWLEPAMAQPVYLRSEVTRVPSQA
jgi:tRNA threonylcarbamoyladenosine biosynthesis protein TsaB